MVSFAVHKLLSLIWSRLFIFVFISIVLGDRFPPPNIIMIYIKTALPMFCSKSYIVSSITFRSLIHFGFIFVYGVYAYCCILYMYCLIWFYDILLRTFCIYVDQQYWSVIFFFCDNFVYPLTHFVVVPFALGLFHWWSSADSCDFSVFIRGGELRVFPIFHLGYLFANFLTCLLIQDKDKWLVKMTNYPNYFVRVSRSVLL